MKKPTNAYRDSLVYGLIYELRPWQWYKQSMLLLGLIFSRNVFSIGAWVNVLLGIAAFCAVASATYIFNDISDLEEDRKHPTKKQRPLASGQIGVPLAVGTGLVLLASGLYMAMSISEWFLIVLLTYIIQNAIYTAYLKHVVIADVLVIAVGFVLRAVAGVVAVGVWLSPWLVACSFLAALLLALGKRRHEMEVSKEPDETRSTLADYEPDTLDQLLVITISTLLMSYSLYTFFGVANEMMVTLPFAFFATFRYQHLVHTSHVSGDPALLMVDRPFMLNLGLWSVAVTVVLYGGIDYVVSIIEYL